MNKEFVPYEQDLELKKLGFDEECFGYYQQEWHDDGMTELEPSLKMIISKQHQHAYQICTAPTFSQAFRWFREKHDLDYAILPELSSGHKLLTRTYNVTIFMYNMNINVQSEILRVNGEIARYIKREEAELDCLKKLIEIVKNK
jgi:hypothetical protein